MNTDAKTLDLTGTQARRNEEHSIGYLQEICTVLPETVSRQRETPCSCPGCFSFGD